MSSHNIGFMKKQNYHLIIIKYPQIHILFLLLDSIVDKSLKTRFTKNSKHFIFYEPYLKIVLYRGFKIELLTFSSGVKSRAQVLTASVRISLNSLAR